jgi:hypothetical protein
MSLFLKQIDAYFHTEYHIIWNTTIKHIQNVHCFFLTGLISYSMYIPNHLNYIPPHILIQCVFDLFLTSKKDILIHHSCVICFISIFQTGIFPSSSEHMQMKSILYLSATEFSTAFLMLQDYIPKKSILRSINMYCFVSSFFYTRLYLVTRYLILEPEYHSFLQSVPFSYKCLLYSSIYGLHLLNIYWGILILRKCFTITITKK